MFCMFQSCMISVSVWIFVTGDCFEDRPVRSDHCTVKVPKWRLLGDRPMLIPTINDARFIVQNASVHRFYYRLELVLGVSFHGGSNQPKEWVFTCLHVDYCYFRAGLDTEFTCLCDTFTTLRPNL